MKLRNSFVNLTKFEWLLWVSSVLVISVSFVLSGEGYWLTLLASLVGVTALIFLAKGDVTGQLLTIVFSILYGIISYRFQYYGEMITYLGMTMPIAMLSVYTWLKHPYEDSAEVEVNKLNAKQTAGLILLTVVVTVIFYFILKALHTTNLLVSTVSIATSFAASYLQAYRSHFYALAYSANDIVLIILWILASVENISYLAMVLCFVMFFVNDIYGYVSWKKMKQRQAR